MSKKEQTLKSLMEGKRFLKVAPKDLIRSVAVEMPKTHSSAAAVLDEKGKLIGIITEQDIVSRAVGARRNVDETRVEQIMTANPITISINDPIAKALMVMTQKGFRTLPVMDGDEFVAIVDIRDLYQGMHKLLEAQSKADKAMIAYAFGESYGIGDYGNQDSKTR